MAVHFCLDIFVGMVNDSIWHETVSYHIRLRAAKSLHGLSNHIERMQMWLGQTCPKPKYYAMLKSLSFFIHFLCVFAYASACSCISLSWCVSQQAIFVCKTFVAILFHEWLYKIMVVFALNICVWIEAEKFTNILSCAITTALYSALMLYTVHGARFLLS